MTYYVNDACSSLTQVLATVDENGNIKQTYLSGLGLISYSESLGNEGNEITYYLSDGRGSVTALLKEGSITDRYHYDAYGNLLKKAGSSENEYLYNGEAYSETTGLYYQRARYMNPTTGTFISMDAYSGTTDNPVSQHKYLYANANPVMYEDPSGYMSAVEIGVTVVMGPILTGLAFAGDFMTSSAFRNDDGSYNIEEMLMYALEGVGWGYILTVGMITFAYLFPEMVLMAEILMGIAATGLGVYSVYESIQNKEYFQAGFRGLMTAFSIVFTGYQLYRNAAGIRQGLARFRDFLRYDNRGCVGGGNASRTVDDFYSLEPSNVRTIQTQYGEGLVGVLSNGGSVVARQGSVTGGATLEIRISNSRLYKIRY